MLTMYETGAPSSPHARIADDLIRDPEGILTFSGVPLDALADRYGTPLLVLSANVARARASAFIDSFRLRFGNGVSVSYAAKALAVPAFLKVLANLDLRFDVVSAGEAALAYRAGIAAGRLRLHGNNKSREELELAATGGVGELILDNPEELARWLALPDHAECPVTIRVAPGISPDTHEYISTGGRGGKFGFDLHSGEALAGLLRAHQGGCRLRGIHAHLGSQIETADVYGESLRRLLDLRTEFARRTGLWLEEVNVGGGPAYRYVDEIPLEPDDWAESLHEMFRSALGDGPAPVLGVEPGRAIAAPSGITLYTVGDVRRVPGFAPVISVDGGMGDNIRPALYGARYRLEPAKLVHGAGRERCHVVGRYCESGDIVVRDAMLPPLGTGDRLAVLGTGAYAFPMSMRYNAVPRPAVVLVEDGRHACVVARETVEDLLRGQRLAPWQTL